MNPNNIKKLKEALDKTTKGPWYIREMPDGNDFFIEAAEPFEREFGYDIEVFGEDDNGYPTRRADFEFAVLAHELLPEILEELIKE